MFPLLLGVIVRPFFSMFGELFLGQYTVYEYASRPLIHPNVHTQNISDIVDTFDHTMCSQVATKSEFEDIAQIVASFGKEIVRCPHESPIVWLLMALYQIVAHALLLNLLIAMFSNTFNRVNQDAIIIWKFQRFDLLKSYHSRPAVVPPFNLIYHPIKLLM